MSTSHIDSISVNKIWFPRASPAAMQPIKTNSRNSIEGSEVSPTGRFTRLLKDKLNAMRTMMRMSRGKTKAGAFRNEKAPAHS